MADELPDEIRLKLMKKLLSTSTTRKEESSRNLVDPEAIVYGNLSDERAREILEKTKALYPDEYKTVVLVLYELLRRKAVDKLDGLTVLAVARRLGLDVRPDLRIRFVKHGREVDFDEYIGK
ncbi:hypothetical protein ACSU1N_01095 [Thermogladius sp. 4427co]|uniref:hypothetical protein n=1 Tax=Thermogladius sp. 4427co TaxID=3450718 RepID=UPI003F79786F